MTLTPYYQDEAVTIYHGDCLDLLPSLTGFGAVITDPPYSSGGQFRGDRARGTVAKYVQGGTAAYRPEFAGDNLDQRTFSMWAEAWLRLARQSSAPGAVMCSFIDWRQLPALTDCVQLAGWTWRNVATWWKPGIRMVRGSFSSSAEYVVYAINGPANMDFDGAVQNVFKCAPAPSKVHIAEKPIDVMRWVLQVVPPKVTVLDPFMGSGATLRAAKDCGHKAVGIEVDELYCEIAARRMAQEVLAL